MIFPLPKEIKNTNQNLATWTAVLINLLVFVLLFQQKQTLNSYQLLEANGLQLTGKIYLNYIKKQKNNQYFELPQWLHHVDQNNNEHLEYVGTYAIRDAQFLHQIKNMPTEGDQVVFLKWQQQMSRFVRDFENEKIFVYGLHQQADSFSHWITYQFSHSQFFHLLSNLCFLFLIGCAVESIYGSFYFILIYLCSGIFGGLFFLNLGTHGSIPMIGASASVSGLIAFFAVMMMQKKIPFFYFISPFPQHFGVIYLPGWLIFPMILVSDLASYLSIPPGLGAQVAHSAHLGGAVFGILFALFLRFLDSILTKTQILKS